MISRENEQATGGGRKARTAAGDSASEARWDSYRFGGRGEASRVRQWTIRNTAKDDAGAKEGGDRCFANTGLDTPHGDEWFAESLDNEPDSLSAAARMTIHSLYVFDRKGVCLYYKSWHRPRHMLASMPEEDYRLMFGLIFSLKQLAQRLSPSPEDERGLKKYRTRSYVLFHLETPTGFHFVLTADESAGRDLRAALWEIYRSIFCPLIQLNPLHEPGSAVCSAFDEAVDEYIRGLEAPAP